MESALESLEPLRSSVDAEAFNLVTRGEERLRLALEQMDAS